MSQALTTTLATTLSNLITDNSHWRPLSSETAAAAAEAVIEAITLGTETTPGFDLHARADLGEFKQGDVILGVDLNTQFSQLAAAFGETSDAADEEEATEE